MAAAPCAVPTRKYIVLAWVVWLKTVVVAVAASVAFKLLVAAVRPDKTAPAVTTATPPPVIAENTPNVAVVKLTLALLTETPETMKLQPGISSNFSGLMAPPG